MKAEELKAEELKAEAARRGLNYHNWRRGTILSPVSVNGGLLVPGDDILYLHRFKHLALRAWSPKIERPQVILPVSHVKDNDVV